MAARRVGTPFLRSRLAPNRFNRACLPWRSGEDDPSGKSQGRGRGKRETTSSLFSDTSPADRPFGKKDSIADDVLEILSTWNTEQDTKQPAPTPTPNKGARKDTVSEEDIQKLLGTFFSPEKATSAPAGDAQGDSSALSGSEFTETDSSLAETQEESDGFYMKEKPVPEAEPESELEYQPDDYDPSQVDLNFDIDEAVRQLNTPETAAELGKLLGLTHPARIHLILTPDKTKIPNDSDLWRENPHEMTEKSEVSLKDKISQEEAEELLPQLHYAFSPEDDRTRQALIDAQKIDTVDPLEKRNAQKIDRLLERCEDDVEKYLHHVESNATAKGNRLGSFLRESHRPTEERYLENREQLDQFVKEIAERKAQNDPGFKAQYERITESWEKSSEKIDKLTFEYGPDHELVLAERRALHNSAVAFANLFDKEDFEGTQFNPLDEGEDLPMHSRYQGAEGEKNFHDDFFNHDVQLLSIAELDKAIPRDYLPYVEAVANTFASPAEAEAAWGLTSIPDSRYQQIGKSVIHEAIDPIDFSKIGGGTRLDDVIPTSIQGVLGTSVAIAEDEHQSALFRMQLENYMAVQLTNGLRGIRDETAEFAETAEKMDKLSARQKQKRTSQKASQMKRQAALSEKFGQPFVHKKSIIARAMEAKGIVDQEDILDQALEILRKEGRKFTHRDIPAIRQTNFQEKFKAIFHNGSIPPMEKAHLVARAISMFIISGDELKIMDGALEIFSTEPTELEIQERKAELQRERLTVNYDNTTMTFAGMEDVEFEEEEDLDQDQSANKQLFEGYNTSDFETDTDAEVTEPMPDDFVRLKQFKDNAEASEAWAYAVDIPLSALRGDGPVEDISQADKLERISKEVGTDSESDPEEISKKK